MSKEKQPLDGSAGFDFFIGSWKASCRNLPERLTGSNRWEQFGLTTVARKILGGPAHIEEYKLDRTSGWTEGLAIRTYDPTSKQWSVYAGDALNGFDPKPMVGSFDAGRFSGYSYEQWQGKFIFCRVVWSDIAAESFHWEQAFSVDGGGTWETNWISEFVRTG